MPLTQDQIAQLNEAINGYDFPAVYFNFNNEIEIIAQNMTEVEKITELSLFLGNHTYPEMTLMTEEQIRTLINPSFKEESIL